MIGARLGAMVAIAALALGLAVPAPASAQDAVAAEPMTVHVDATDLERRILGVRQTLAVRPGPLKLWFPRWIPGEHAPTGEVHRLAGLRIEAQGRRLDWRRDPADTHAFLLEVPEGVRRIEIGFQHLSPTTPDSGRRIVTGQIVNLQWNDLLLYPAGPAARDIAVRAELSLPAGWQAGTALRPEREGASPLRFKPVSLEMLVDSPVFAARHLRRLPLDPDGAARPVTLVMVADKPEQLQAPTDEQLAGHRRMVEQADKLFGTRPFAHYDFLFALSDELGGIGLEHHQSSENAVEPGYFQDWGKSVGDRELLPHEYVHAWNGKYRRPAGLATPHYNTPTQSALLWLYEGQTEFWGKVLAARAGLVSAELARDELAQVAAGAQARIGRAWRNLQDTVHEPVMHKAWGRDWRDWQRDGGDYYSEAALLWLEADMLIRELSAGQRSLDDFARRFFGAGRDGELGPSTYEFGDVVAALGEVQPHDWARFLRERLDTHDAAPLGGLGRAGWALAFDEAPSSNFAADESRRGPALDLRYSLGLRLGNEGRVQVVAWESPAYKAGLVPGMQVVAVGMQAYKSELLKQAITANKDGRAPIELLLRHGDAYRMLRIDYRGGLRYPKLVRVDGTPDRLASLLAAR